MPQTETWIFGGGCFWCIEAILRETKGVIQVESGYASGHTQNPTYHEVCSGNTGHAEVVRVKIDPTIISASTLLELFFSIHDPTTLNRQGHDVGTQYRSIILYANAEQENIAKLALIHAKKNWSNPLVTEIVPGNTFWSAESEHQDYFRRNPRQGYCQMIIAPKLAKFRQQHPELVKSTP